MNEDLKALKRLPIFGSLRADLMNGEGIAMVNELTLINDEDPGVTIDILDDWIEDIYIIRLSLLAKIFFSNKPIDLSKINDAEIDRFKARMKAEYGVEVGEDFRDYLFDMTEKHSEDIDQAERARQAGTLN